MTRSCRIGTHVIARESSRGAPSHRELEVSALAPINKTIKRSEVQWIRMLSTAAHVWVFIRPIFLSIRNGGNLPESHGVSRVPSRCSFPLLPALGISKPLLQVQRVDFFFLFHASVSGRVALRARSWPLDCPFLSLRCVPVSPLPFPFLLPGCLHREPI